MKYAYGLGFASDYISAGAGLRKWAQSVRLVTDVTE